MAYTYKYHSEFWWKDKLMRVLSAFAEAEGTWHESFWRKNGISEEDEKEINEIYEEWLNGRISYT